MFLEPRESHRLCPFRALVPLRAGALGSCELERSGQRGMETIKGHTEGPGQLNLAGGAGPVGSLRPQVPLCGKSGSLSGGGEQYPPRVLEILYMEVVEERRCQQEQSCVQAKFEEWGGLWTALWVL